MSKIPRRILARVIVYSVLIGVVASGLMVGREVASDLNWHHLRLTEWIERDENKQWWYGFTVANRGWRCETLRISVREMDGDTSHEVNSVSMELAPEQSENIKIVPDERLYAQVHARRGDDFVPVKSLSLRRAMKNAGPFQWKRYRDLAVFDRPNILLPLSPGRDLLVEVETVRPKSGSLIDLTYHIWLPEEWFEYFGEDHLDTLTLKIGFYEHCVEILDTGGGRVAETGQKHPILYYTLHKDTTDVLRLRFRVPVNLIRTPESRFTYLLEIQLPDSFSHGLAGGVPLETPPRFPFVKRWIGRILTAIVPM